MRFCFIHAADLHLDTPFEGIGRVKPFVAEALRDASLEAFDRLVELAESRAAAFVVLSGDIYDGAERGVRAQLRFYRGLERLSNLGIRSFVVHGNHDPVETGWSAIRHGWPELTTVFGHSAVESVLVERDGAPVATVRGISFARRAEADNLALRFARGKGSELQVGVLHCNVGGDTGHDPYALSTLDDLTQVGLDYWALGHVHARRVLREGNPWVVYPGDTQGRSFKPSEGGAKGAYVVEVDGNQVQVLEFCPLDVVRFEALEVDVGDIEDAPALERLLLDKVESLREESEGRSLLVRATLVGSGPVHGDLARDGALSGLLQDLRDESESDSPFVWWDGFRDETNPKLDLDAVRRRGDFASELLAFSDGLAGDSEARRAFVEGRLRELPAGELGRMGVMVPDPADPEVLQHAAEIALELLEGEVR